MIEAVPTERNRPSWRWMRTSSSLRSGPPIDLTIAQCHTSVSTRLQPCERRVVGLAGARERRAGQEALGARVVPADLGEEVRRVLRPGHPAADGDGEASRGRRPSHRALRPSPST